MNKIISKGPILNSAKCRCCGNIKKCRILNVEYDHMGEKEIYNEIIMDCFGILLSNTDSDVNDRCVCATCVVRLRDARQFKAQILKCEHLFLERIHSNENPVETETAQNEMKCDTEPYGSDLDHGDNVDDIGESLAFDLNETKTTITKTSARSIADNKISNKSKSKYTVMKKNMLKSMKKLKRIVGDNDRNEEKAVPKTSIIQPNSLRDEDTMVHHNVQTIVEYSYVCPFRNRISNYYCHYCKSIFTTPSELRAHTMTHDPKCFDVVFGNKRLSKIDITRIDCRLCDAKIDDLNTFKSHIQEKHKKIFYPTEKLEFLAFKLNDHNTIQCLLCNETFLFIDKLIEHLVVHYGRFICDYCGAKFIEETSLVQHLRRHKNTRPSGTCEVCGKYFKSVYTKNQHFLTVHEKKPMFPCYKCDASFLSHASRNRHLINEHGECRKFACNKCDKVFDVRKTMIEHLRKRH